MSNRARSFSATSQSSQIAKKREVYHTALLMSSNSEFQRYLAEMKQSTGPNVCSLVDKLLKMVIDATWYVMGPNTHENEAYFLIAKTFLNVVK